MGLALAHQLARRGQSVQVISRRRSEAAGFVAAGMLAPHAEGLSGNLLALGQRSLELVPSWLRPDGSRQRPGLRTPALRHRCAVPQRTGARWPSPQPAAVSRSTEMRWNVKSQALPLAGALACCSNKTAKSTTAGG